MINSQFMIVGNTALSAGYLIKSKIQRSFSQLVKKTEKKNLTFTFYVREFSFY